MQKENKTIENKTVENTIISSITVPDEYQKVIKMLLLQGEKTDFIEEAMNLNPKQKRYLNLEALKHIRL